METLQLSRHLIFAIIFQSVDKFTHSIVNHNQTDIIELLKNTLQNLNNSIKNAGIIYSNLTPEQAEKEISILDNLYKILSGIFNIIFSELKPEEYNIVRPEYDILLVHLEEMREGLELFCNEEFMQTIKEVKSGNLSNFIKVA